MITFKNILQEENETSKYANDIKKVVSILDGALNNQHWMKHTHFEFKQNGKEIREYIKANIEPYNYQQGVKEELVKKCNKILQDVGKVIHLPQSYSPEDTKYYTVKALGNWSELEKEIEAIFKMNLDVMDADSSLSKDLILKDSK